MKPRPIVDAHVHFWDPARFGYPWLRSVPALNHGFLPEHLATALGNAEVEKFVFVECGCDPSRALAEADWASALAIAEPRIRGIVAQAPLEKGAQARACLEALKNRPLVRGIRRSLQDESDPEFCLLPEFLAGVELLGEFGWPFDLCVRQTQLRAATELVRRVPQVTFVLDHFGKPEVRGGKSELWARDLGALAELPNAVCKVSGLTTEADWANWRPEDLRFYFERAFECFGFDRVLFGGDWPVATLATGYERWLDVVREAAAAATDSECAALFQTNAERIYRV